MQYVPLRSDEVHLGYPLPAQYTETAFSALKFADKFLRIIIITRQPFIQSSNTIAFIFFSSHAELLSSIPIHSLRSQIITSACCFDVFLSSNALALRNWQITLSFYHTLGVLFSHRLSSLEPPPQWRGFGIQVLLTD